VKVGLKAAELKGSAPRKVALGILIWKKNNYIAGLDRESIADEKRRQCRTAVQLLSRTRPSEDRKKLPLALCEFIANQSSQS